MLKLTNNLEMIYKSLTDSVSDLKKRGLLLKEKNEGADYDPTLPDLIELTSNDLGNLLVKYTNAISFIAQQVAIIASEKLIAEKFLKKLGAKKMLEVEGKNREERLSKVEIDKEMLEAELKYLVASNKLKLAESILEGYRISRDTISREITRRLGSKQYEGGNYGG
jgi:hypothetical protein